MSLLGRAVTPDPAVIASASLPVGILSPTIALSRKPGIARGQDPFAFASGKCETRAHFPKSLEFYGYSEREKWGWILVFLDEGPSTSAHMIIVIK